MNELKIVTYQNQRILNTQQLAESYDTSVKRISQNFNANKERYQEGKHYFFLQGDELSSFFAIRKLRNAKSKSQINVFVDRKRRFPPCQVTKYR